MSLDEKYQELSLRIDPRKQVICKHVGLYHPTHGWQINPIKDGDGHPALRIFTRKEMRTTNYAKYGWEEYKPEGQSTPKAARPAKRTTKK